MSYLDVPRIHFGGPFFTGPATMNNVETNYLPGQTLNPVWNPTGVNLFYFQGCRVLSTVDQNSTVNTDPAQDPLINAPVETPSPQTPKTDPSGHAYDIAKLVDLDPDQQGRSAVYGLRIFVTLSGGVTGFSGLMSVPNIRNMNQRVPPVSGFGGSWFFGCPFQGVLNDIQWTGDLSASAFLSQFKDACEDGISVNLYVDLHQNNPDFQGVEGDEFKYGRVMGTLGPAYPGEPEQFVAGRWLDSVSQSWNPVPYIVRPAANGNPAYVSIDLGAAIQLQSQPTTDPPNQLTSNGHLTVDDGIQVGYASQSEAAANLDHERLPEATSAAFTPLTNGAVSYSDQYASFVNAWKTVDCLDNSGVVDIQLTGDEAELLADTPLQVALMSVVTSSGWAVVLQERSDGRYINCRQTSLRMQQPDSGTTSVQVQFDSLQFGAPWQGDDSGLALEVQVVQWSQAPSGRWRNSIVSSDSLATQIESTADSDGNKTWWVTVTAKSDDLDIPEIRASQDSLVYYISATQAALSGADIGDNNAFLSVLLWAKFDPPAYPTWDDDVGPILQQFALLYPGMKSILDIGDESVYQSPQVRAEMKARLGADRDDPAYMPLTRDLSDGRVQMILTWLDQQS